MDENWDNECREIEWLKKMVKVKTEELSWWQYRWEVETEPHVPEMAWICVPTGRAVKNNIHIACQDDDIDEDAAVVFNELPLFVTVTRIDRGEYMFGRIRMWAEFGEPDEDGDKDLLGCIALPNEEEAPEIEDKRWSNFNTLIKKKYKQEHLFFLKQKEEGKAD